MSAIDPTKSALDNLLVLVNAANTGQTISDTQVTAAAATVKTDTGDGRNTSVVLSAVAGQGYNGSQTVNYTRRGLNDSVTSPNFNHTATVGDTAAAIIAAVATANGLVASELHLEAPGAPGVPVTGAINNSPATLNLVSAAGSLLYIDSSSQAITFTWNEPSVALSTAIATVNLVGFDAAS
jgi:hypothetical protein